MPKRNITADLVVTTGGTTDTIHTKPMDADTATELARLARAAGVPIAIDVKN